MTAAPCTYPPPSGPRSVALVQAPRIRPCLRPPGVGHVQLAPPMPCTQCVVAGRFVSQPTPITIIASGALRWTTSTPRCRRFSPAPQSEPAPNGRRREPWARAASSAPPFAAATGAAPRRPPCDKGSRAACNALRKSGRCRLWLRPTGLQGPGRSTTCCCAAPSGRCVPICRCKGAEPPEHAPIRGKSSRGSDATSRCSASSRALGRLPGGCGSETANRRFGCCGLREKGGACSRHVLDGRSRGDPVPGRRRSHPLATLADRVVARADQRAGGRSRGRSRTPGRVSSLEVERPGDQAGAARRCALRAGFVRPGGLRPGDPGRRAPGDPRLNTDVVLARVNLADGEASCLQDLLADRVEGIT